MTAADPGQMLRRLERTALVFCALAAAVALALRPRTPGLALGILGGGALIGTSYWAIRASVDGLIALVGSHGDNGPRWPGRVSLVLRFTGRYALLALLAYAMIARLQLHPIGLLIGVSSAVVAASFEAIRLLSVTGGAARREPSGTSPKNS